MKPHCRKWMVSLGLAWGLAGLGCGLAAGQSPAEKALLEKAHAQEASGHIDLAAQSWQQILLSDPNNQEALAGLARWAKINGRDAESEKYLQRLRAVNPSSPEIGRAQSLMSNRAQNQLLQQAAELARANRPEQALKIFHQAFGTTPPDNWALAYYDTEAALESTREDAVRGLRGLMAKYPDDPQYAIDLGRVLTYSAKTRTEGERILKQHPQDPQAQAALRQALQWDVQNPAESPEIRQYLKEHPDAELAKELAETEARQGTYATGLAKTPAERDAYTELGANHLEAAERQFTILHDREPQNPRVMAGLGFLRMKQSNFPEATTWFEQAEENGLHSAVIDESLATSRFWGTMQKGTEALNDNRLDAAEQAYRAALAMRPANLDARTGLAGLYMKRQQPQLAIPLYQELVKTQPKSEAVWRGLFMAEAQAGDARTALITAEHFPAAVSLSLRKDPDYLRALASVYMTTGQTAEAQRVFIDALNLPAAQKDAQIRSEIRLQYAGLLVAGRRYPQAAAIYRDLLNADVGNVNAWQGLVAMEHQMGRDPDAITIVERMPPDAYEQALHDTGFLLMLAAIYQTQNHPDVAQEFLDRAVKVYEENGQALPMTLQLQIAAVDLQRNHPEAAYRIYRQALTQHPDQLDAWIGLLAALHQTGHDADALAQIQQIPPDVLRRLDSDVRYEQTAAAIYAANGDQQIALGMTERVQEHYRVLRVLPPADVEIQNAWLLFNGNDDADLYRQLMALGDRTDMSDEQRRQVQTIWASWAQRRATQAAAMGNQRRALEILTAAAQAFPGNPAVSRALATGYLQAGDPKDALAIYQSLDLTNATATDYQSMVGAALAAQNMKLAEGWLRVALEKYPNNASVLAAAARFEQARGDTTRAADYWKASLNAMPAVAPATELAHKLDQPDALPQNRTRTEHGNDLVSLLNPEGAESPAQGANAVPLPSYRNPSGSRTTTASTEPYGPDPYYMGTAPVQMNSAPTAASTQNGEAQGELPLPAAAGGPLVPQNPAQPTTTTTPRPYGDTTPMTAPPATQPPTQSPAQPLFRPEASVGATAPETTATLNLPDLLPAEPVSPPAQSTTQLPMVTPAAVNPDATADANLPDLLPAPPVSPPVETTAQLPMVTPAAVNPDAQPATGSIPEKEPDQLVLETSPALVPVPNADDEALRRAEAALAAAARPVDSDTIPTQYEPTTQQIQPTQEAGPTPQTQEPLYYQRPPAVLNNSPADATAQPQTTAAGASDEQLMQENLPPLRGPYQKNAIVRPPNPREEAQQQLANIQGGYSPWLGGTGFANHRSGTAGFDSLSALEAPFEASAPIGTSARLTVISRPSFLDSGIPTTSPILPGGVAERLGTAAANSALNQQNATGIGGEVQLALPTFAVGVGYSPYGFLVSNVIGRLNWKPDNGPFTISFARDSVRDSQLSYSGLRDPGSATPGFEGNVWGGVVSTGGEVAFGKGDAGSGYYVSGGYQYVDGVHVETNHRVDGDAGAYWRVKEIPDRGSLTVGVNFFAMHYTHNLVYFTYGQGGYFSPQAYFLANVPITWSGRYGLNFHYTVAAALGVQAFQEDSGPYFPLDSALEVASNNPSYSSQTTVGGNYDLKSQGAYHLTDHWYAGGFLDLNNTQSYNNQVVGFYVRYLFRPQVPTELGPTGLYPWDGLRPYKAP